VKVDGVNEPGGLVSHGRVARAEGKGARLPADASAWTGNSGCGGNVIDGDRRCVDALPSVIVSDAKLDTPRAADEAIEVRGRESRVNADGVVELAVAVEVPLVRQGRGILIGVGGAGSVQNHTASFVHTVGAAGVSNGRRVLNLKGADVHRA